MGILKHAIHEIIFNYPVKGVKIQGSYEDWRGLPEDKSLFCQPPGQGLVIGNLTSQFFSNIYLDVLDRFITITLGYKHYGRYVDDLYYVVTKEALKKAKRDIRIIDNFLNGLGPSLNKKKTHIFSSNQAIPFLGMTIKDHAIMPGRRITHNFTDYAYRLTSGYDSLDAIVSYLGILHHCNSGKAINKIFSKVG